MLLTADYFAWLNNSDGKSVDFRAAQIPEHHQGSVPSADQVEKEGLVNRAYRFFFPKSIGRKTVRCAGFPLLASHTRLAMSSCEMAGRNAAYLPDQDRICTWLNASDDAKGIVVCGKFTGCTFARCIHDGKVMVAHIYVKTSIPEVDPSTQARNFEHACGAPLNSATGFKTAEKIDGANTVGYVIGVRLPASLSGSALAERWGWLWMTINVATNLVLSCRKIEEAEWTPI
jgi:hypothetical protein